MSFVIPHHAVEPLSPKLPDVKLRSTQNTSHVALCISVRPEQSVLFPTTRGNIALFPLGGTDNES